MTRFKLLLCRTVLHCTLEELYYRMSNDEVLLWFAEHLLEPWEKMTDTILSYGFTATANSFGGDYKPKHFIPQFDSGSEEDQAKKAQLELEMFDAQVEAHNRRLNGIAG